MALPNGDIVVVLPGILGSRLTRNGATTWGLGHLAGNLGRLGRKLTADLSLPPEAFDEEHQSCGIDDGTRHDGPLTTVGIIPGFWSVVEGYDRLCAELRRRFGTDQDFIMFPYDWRQSNRVTAHRLQNHIEPIIERRRAVWPEARIQFVAHSMGGLVARYYAEVLDRNRHTRQIISIGTPYRGAVKALKVLCNDELRLGPFTFPVGDLARSLPSVAELLPLYPSVGGAGDGLRSLTDDDTEVTGLPDHVRTHGLTFYREIMQAHRDNGDDAPAYVPIVGITQQTEEWVTSDNGRVTVHPVDDVHQFGDGTVPRQSAIPPEWRNGSAAKFATGRHASIQQSQRVYEQIYGALSDIDRPPLGTDDDVAVEASPVAVVHGEWEITAHNIAGNGRLLLEVVLAADDGDGAPRRVSMRPDTNGWYRARLTFERPGAYRWTVGPIGGRGVTTPVSDGLYCVDDV
jgi:pimeloyl-ACP methyl ester carboxylesterase